MKEKVRERMKSKLKQGGVVLIAVIMACTMFPLTASAGDSALWKYYINGTENVTSTYPGAKITVNKKDLTDYGYISTQNDGIDDIYCTVYKTNDFGEGNIITKKIKFTLNGDKFELTISDIHAGYYYVIYTHNTDTNYNTNTGFIKVTDTATINDGPYVTNCRYSEGITTSNVTIDYFGVGTYTWQGASDTTESRDILVELSCNGKVITTKTTTNTYGYGDSMVFNNVPMKYCSANTVTAKIGFKCGRKTVWETGTPKSFTVYTKGLGKNTVYATKISKDKASLHWSGVTGASGYYVYQGSKKIKTCKASARSCVIKRSKIGTSKIKVIPYVKSGSTVYKGTSNVKKPSSNAKKYLYSTYYGDYPYPSCRFVVKKMSLSGNTYTVTGYAVNNRIFKMKKYGKLTVKVKCGGKVVASKTWKNLKVNCPASSSKKITLKIKGKSGKDIKYSGGYSVSYKPYWEIVGYN